MEHGLVVGKFFPPHAGHLFLVRSAAFACERVTVGVYDRESRALPLATRAEALRGALRDHPTVRVVWGVDDVPIDYGDPAIWERHVAIFRAGLDGPVDAVFTSEAYGDELARRLGCRHVCLDLPRSWQRVSGSRLRADPAAHWRELLPEVRRALCKRVVVVGAESSGTTTLARSLAETLGAAWVPEHGREHTILKVALGGSLAEAAWETRDFLHVARTQASWEAAAAATSPAPVLVLDTDAVATAIWHERYLDRASPELEPVIASLPPRTLYILTDHADVPFEDDGLRDGAHLRAWMTRRFEEELDRRGLPWIKLSGPPEGRLAAAARAVRDCLAQGWRWD